MRELRTASSAPRWSRPAPQIGPEDLGLAAGAPRCAAATAGAAEADEAERDALERLLLDSGGSVSRAAARLGISRQALYRRMEPLGIVLERRPRA